MADEAYAGEEHGMYQRPENVADAVRRIDEFFRKCFAAGVRTAGHP